MKHVKLTIHLSDELTIKQVTIDYNDTELPSDSGLIQKIAFTLLKSISANKDDMKIQDLLNELNIKW